MMETTISSMKSLGTLGVFLSYSHKDSDLKDELETHLSTMKRHGVIETWHDRRIVAGEKWADQIDQHLNAAQIILLLISPDFVASDYCYGKEMARAHERNAKGEAQVIPVILRPGEYRGASFLEYQCLPEGGKPVTRWLDRDEAFANVAKGIRDAVDARLYRIQQQQKAELDRMKKEQLALGDVFRRMQEDKENFEKLSPAEQKTRMERWKKLQDTQTEIFSIRQEITASKAKAQDKNYTGWDKYIKA
jgi:TIR domain